MHSPGIGQVEGNRHRQHKCKYCSSIFVVCRITAFFAEFCAKTLRFLVKKKSNKTSVFSRNRAEVNIVRYVNLIYARAQRTDIRWTLLPSVGRLQYVNEPLLGHDSDQVFQWNGFRLCPRHGNILWKTLSQPAQTMWLTDEMCLWWHPNVFHGNSWYTK